MTKLKPCPFCGGEAKLKHTDITSEYREASYVICTVCYARGRIVSASCGYCADDHVIEEWNRRAE